MITTLGKNHIRQYLAGIVPSIGDYIAIGTRPVEPALGDVSMGFEAARVEVTSVTVDPVTDKVIFKGTAQDGNDVKVHEIGLWFSPANADSSVLLNFQYQDMDWEGDLVEYTGPEPTPPHRIGQEGVMIQPGDVMSAYVSDVDLSAWLGAEDEWVMGMSNMSASGPTSVKLKALSLDNSYMEFTFDFPATTGPEYQFASTKVRDAVAVGAFDLSMIQGYEVSVVDDTTARWIMLDGVVVNNTPAEREGSVLIARALIDPPFVTNADGEFDVEYELGVIV